MSGAWGPEGGPERSGDTGMKAVVKNLDPRYSQCETCGNIYLVGNEKSHEKTTAHEDAFVSQHSPNK